MKPKRLVTVRYRKNRGTWEVHAALPPGSDTAYTRKTYATEEEATAAANELMQRIVVAEPIKDQDMTLGQAFDKYFQAKSRKKSLAEDRRIAEHLKKAFGESTRLRLVTSARIARYKAERLAAKSERRKDDNGKATPLSAASVNRPLALLRHLLRIAAQEWEVIPKVPVVRLEREPQGRLRWLEVEEETRLLAACAKSQNPDLLAIVTVALETGMRQGEVLGLTWDRVDMSRGVIRLEVTKSGKRREVPMRDKVYKVLSARPNKSGRVWPDQSIRKAFESAVERAEIENFTFHDLRHTFASRYMQRKGSLPVLREILGHATLAMTMRYAHLSPAHLRDEMAKTETAGAGAGEVLEPDLGAKPYHVLVSTGAGGGS